MNGSGAGPRPDLFYFFGTRTFKKRRPSPLKREDLLNGRIEVSRHAERKLQ